MPRKIHDPIPEYGPALARIRGERSISQAELAAAVGSSQNYLSDLERGRRNPTIVTIFELASSLGTDHVALVMPDKEARSEKASRRRR